MAADYARRRSTASRSASLVGGQLAQSFADLSANERIPTLRDTGHVHADPPDRRPSMFPPPTIEGLPRFQGFQAFPILRDSLDVPQPGHPARLGRPSLTRPSTPETARPVLRRSSLTEIIMAKSGDDVAMASGRFHPVQEGGFPMDRPSLSEQINITGWPVRRASTDSVVSVPGINLNSDSEDAGPPPTSLGRKGPTEARNLGLEDGDVDMKGDPSMRGMEMLAEFAQRVAEEERKGRTSEERDPSPGKGGVGPKYTCAYCAKTFSRPSSLRIHTYSREQHFSLFTFSR